MADTLSFNPLPSNQGIVAEKPSVIHRLTYTADRDQDFSPLVPLYAFPSFFVKPELMEIF